MKTIALRFGEFFAPPCGTIAAHQATIDQVGFVWYGKLGNTLSEKTITSIMDKDDPVILLINSGKTDRYWAHVREIKKEIPEKNGIPEYYRDRAEDFKVWFKIVRFEKAEANVLALCSVASSGKQLSEVSRHSMTPYFIINYEEANHVLL